jgi:hypothetical protein
MKLRYIDKNGYGILVDDNASIKKGDCYLDDCHTVRKAVTSDQEYWDLRPDYSRIVFAEKPLELDVPEIEWRKFALYFKAQESCNEREGIIRFDRESDEAIGYRGYNPYRDHFMQGFQANPYRFSEEALRKAYEAGQNDYQSFYHFLRSVTESPLYITVQAREDDPETPFILYDAQFYPKGLAVIINIQFTET